MLGRLCRAAILPILTVVSPALRLPLRHAAMGRGEDSVRTTRQDGIRIILGACAVAAWTDLVVARQPDAPLPGNLDVDPQFQVVVEGLRQRSPAFRRQVARIGAARTFRVRVLPE